MRARKRIISLICTVFLAATVFAGCSKDETASSEINISGVNEFPIVEEPVELTIFSPKPTMMSDIETNEFTKWFEEKTGVHVNWELAQGDTTQAINLKITSGELPDIFFGCGFTNAQSLSYGEQGIFIDMTDLIDQYSYNIKNILNDREDIRKAVTLGGSIYALPLVNETMNTLYQNKMFVYKPWLDKLGLNEPTTTEEFYQMLKAFKEQDPNGNGQADEVPLAARGIPGNTGIELFLMNAFQYTSETRMYIDNGEVKFCADTDDYKEGLKYLNKLYSEGLLVSDVFTIDRNGITALGASNPPTLGAATGMYTGMFCLTSDVERCNEFIPISPLKGPEGVQATTKANYLVYPGRFCITNACKYPEVAIKWVDYLYSWEGYMKQSGGDVGLRTANPGELNYAGEQAEYAYDEVDDTTPFGVVQNKNWGGSTFGVSYMDTELELLTAPKPTDTGATLYEYTVNKYLPYAQDKSYSEQTTMKSSDEEIRYNELYTQIKDEVDNWFTDFVMGQKSIDNDWNAYLDRLDQLGLNEMLQLCQDAIN